MAGTINTTNYNFKKYAADGTVSILQTFNGNMDGIDAAIKAREDENTVTSANVAKVAQGLTSVNEAIETTNNTVRAINVQVQTVKQNVTSQGTEIESLGSRVSALEDGGQEIIKIVASPSESIAEYFVSLLRQGNRISGNGTIRSNTASGALIPAPWKNWNGVNTYASTVEYATWFTIAGNVFSLNANENAVIGSSVAVSSSAAVNSPLLASYNGANTIIKGWAGRGTAFTSDFNINYLI